jgi:YD repeat-containing protein
LAVLAAAGKSGVGPGAVSVPSGPGSIEGLGDSYEVQLNTGTAKYGVSVALPPGRAGLAPSVKAGYDTGAGNGLLGIGWNIGFMSIRRQQDKGFPQFNDADTFIFGGEELVPLSNSANDWRCKNERSFQRVRQLRDANAWEVTEPNGTKHILGQYHISGQRISIVTNPNAQGSAFDQTYMWCVDTSIDVHGNRIEYEYQAGAGILYPSRITYSHWPSPNQVGQTNYHEVTFLYESRPDVFDDFRSTFQSTTDLRLKRVEVASFYDGARHLVRAYGFEYSYKPEDLMPLPPDGAQDLGVSLLRRVVQYGNDGNPANYLPPLLLSYSTFNLNQSRLQTIDPPAIELNEVHGNVQLVDIDGDGLPDLFQTTDFDQRFQLNKGELPPQAGGDPLLQFGDVIVQPRDTGMVLQDPESALLDLNGDGLVDYVRLSDGNFGARQIHFYKNQSALDHYDPVPPGFSMVEEVQFDVPPGVSLTNAAVKQMDVNFDKRIDFVVSEPGFFGQFRFIYKDDSDQWQELVTPYPNDMPGALTFAWNGSDGGSQAVYLADMNGDRMPDVVLVQSVGNDLQVTYWPYVGLGAFGASRTMSVVPPDEFVFETADFRDVYVQDLTGDGLADILMVDGSSDQSRIVFRANVAGASWSQPYERDGLPHYAPRDPGSPTTFRLADLNGNGSTDLIWVNPGALPGWQWLDLQPQIKPNLLVGIDNSLGKLTYITYGNITEDIIRAREKGYPWQTKVPFPMQVVRRLRVTPGYDLDGVSDLGRPFTTDQYVSDIQYRDGYYDAVQRQFRGFAFAQKIDYGDDFLLDTNLVSMIPSPGWDKSKTPTGQVQDPSAISRLKYYTGAPDGVDNDEYPPGYNGPRFIDEYSDSEGHEEEPLKGLIAVQEGLDPWVLHDPAGAGDFDRGCWLALTSTNAAERMRMTPDDYVFQRVRSEYTIRRLYRSQFPTIFSALIDGERTTVTNIMEPPGRFASSSPPIYVLPQSGRTVSYVFETGRDVENPEANGLLSDVLGYPRRSPSLVRTEYDHDDFGNEILEKSYGSVSTNDLHDHRIVTTTIALGGSALDKWLIRLPAQMDCTDFSGAFISRRQDFYDGDPFVGLPLGVIGDRGLLSRVEGFINGDTAVPAFDRRTDLPGDPRLPVGKSIPVQRLEYDSSGNEITSLDPLATTTNHAFGHYEVFSYDPRFNQYAASETRVVGGGASDLVISAEYDPGTGKMIRVVNFDGATSTYAYDAFNRIVAAIHPGDSSDLPTLTYSYLPGDPTRSRLYNYDTKGNLTLGVEVGAASRIVSKQRLISGQTNVYVSLKYVDGMQRDLASVSQGDSPGHWVVLGAHGIGRRGHPVESWLSFDLQYGAGNEDYPPFAWIMTTASRPPPADLYGRPIFSRSTYLDSVGRTIKMVEAPDKFIPGETNLVRRHSETWFLPLEVQEFDANDTTPGSTTAGTPQIKRMDGLGRTIEVGEVTRQNDDGTRSQTLREWTTRFSYDLNQNLTEVQDSQGNVKWFRYDGLSRKIFVNDLDRGPVTLTFDDASNQIGMADAKGQEVLATYDGINRILTRDYLDDQNTEFSYSRHPDITFHYDHGFGALPAGDGGIFQTRLAQGRLGWVEDATGETHFAYDSRGRVTEILKRVFDWESPPDALGNRPMIPFRTALTFDAFDRIVSRVYPDNDEVRQEFSQRNLVSRIYGDALGAIVSMDSHFPNGKTRSSTYGDGAVTTFEEDPRYRTTRLRTYLSSGSITNDLVDFGYEYDELSTVSAITDLRPSSVHSAGDPQRNTQVFEYDDLYRLTKAAYSFGVPGGTNVDGGFVSYRYDRIGNLLSQQSGIVQS